MELLERDGELAALWAGLDGARRRHGSVVLVTGEAGIGKTTLVRAFCDAVASRARVLRGACDALSTPRPLGPLRDVAARSGGELAAAVRAGSGPTPVSDALLQLLAERPVPTVLLVEDLHWSDEATIDVLRFVAARIADTSSLLVLTFRDDELSVTHPVRLLLGDLAGSHDVRELALRRLTAEAVRRLSTGAEVDVADLVSVTGGNPFFVTEVLSAGTGSALPRTVRDAVLARVTRLSPDARRALDLVAVSEPPVPPRLVLEAGHVDPATLDEVVASGTVVAHREGLAFRHELGRRVVDEAVPPGRRTDLHGRVLSWLERDGADPAALAHHAEGAGDRAAVRTYAVEAARAAAAVGAHREAASQYHRALRWSIDAPAEERADLLEHQALQAELADDPESARASRAEAVEIRRRLGDPARLGASLRRYSRALWMTGRSSEAVTAGEEALQLLEAGPVTSELAMALSNLSQLAMLDRDHATALEHGARAIAIAEELSDLDTLVHALNNVGTARLMRGEEEGPDLLERSLQLAQEHGFAGHAGRAYCNLASVRCEQRDYDRAAEPLERGIVYCRERHQDYYVHYLRAWRARYALERGRWDEAESEARAVTEIPGVATVTRIVSLTVLGSLGARRGEATAAATLQQAWELAHATGDLQRTWPVATARCEAAWLGLTPRGAIVEEATGVLELAVSLAHPWASGELATWLRRLGALDHFPDHVAAAPYRLQAAGDLRGAGEAWRALGCPYEEALVLAERVEDVEALSRAHQLALDLGAKPLLDRTAQQLRARGVLGLPGSARRTTRAHPSGLTVRQAEVLELLAAGLRDAEIAERLFISPKTAGHHVSAILAKLGVSSRGEAVARAHALGLVGETGRASGAGGT